VISENFPYVFGGKEFLLGGWSSRGGCGGIVGGGESTTVGVAFGLEFGPSFGFFFEGEWCLLLLLLLLLN